FLGQFTVPTPNAMPTDIIRGLEGALVFTEQGGAKIGWIQLGLTDSQSFVQSLYFDALGRPGTLAALFPWANFALQAGSEATARLIEQSPEARFHLVKNWYVQFLGRSSMPSDAEVLPWVNLLLSGATEEQVLSEILASDEFYARAQTLQTS